MCSYNHHHSLSWLESDWQVCRVLVMVDTQRSQLSSKRSLGFCWPRIMQRRVLGWKGSQKFAAGNILMGKKFLALRDWLWIVNMQRASALQDSSRLLMESWCRMQAPNQPLKCDQEMHLWVESIISTCWLPQVVWPTAESMRNIRWFAVPADASYQP